MLRFLKMLFRAKFASGCIEGQSKLHIEFQSADINALLSKQIFVAKEVRFYACKKNEFS